LGRDINIAHDGFVVVAFVVVVVVLVLVSLPPPSVLIPVQGFVLFFSFSFSINPFEMKHTAKARLPTEFYIYITLLAVVNLSLSSVERIPKDIPGRRRVSNSLTSRIFDSSSLIGPISTRTRSRYMLLIIVNVSGRLFLG